MPCGHTRRFAMCRFVATSLLGVTSWLLTSCSSVQSNSDDSQGSSAVQAFACQQTAQAKTQSRMISPANQESNVDPYQAFQWTSDTRAIEYGICVGTQVGQSNVWAGETTSTTIDVPGLQPNTPYYVRLQVEYANREYAFTDSTFTSGTGLAHLTDPVDGATDVDPRVLFSWTAVLDAQMYYLYLSKKQPGGSEVYNSGELPNITVLGDSNIVPNTMYYNSYRHLNLPQLEPNTKYYARLSTRKNGVLFYVDSSFQTGYGIAHLMSAGTVPGAGGVSATPLFSWNAVADGDPLSAYSLNLGSQPGANDVWQSGPLSDTSVTVPEGVLQPNATYYVHLGTNKNGVWQYSDGAFSTGPFSNSQPVAANILYPPNGATNVNPLAPIVWSSPTGASGYTLLIGDGTTTGSNDGDYVNYGLMQQTAWTGGLVGGKTYYATLVTFSTSPEPACSTSSPCWSTNSITFTTGPSPMPHNQGSFYKNVAVATAAVRNMATSQFDYAVEGTFLYNNTNPEHAGQPACSDFAYNLVAQLRNLGFIVRERGTVFGAGPASHGIVEYYDPNLGKWAVADADYGVVYYDSSKDPHSMSLEDISQALSNGAYGSIPFEFVTSSSVSPGCPTCFGNYWAAIFPMDPILLYLNPISIETGLPAANDPKPFLFESSRTDAAGGFIFEFQNPQDSVTVQESYWSQVQVSPAPPPVTSPLLAAETQGDYFSDAIFLNQGWSYVTSPPPGMTLERSVCPLFPGPNCP